MKKYILILFVILCSCNNSKKEYQEYLKTSYWHEVRQIILKRDGYKCQMCGSTYHLQVHHKQYGKRFTEKEHLDWLVTLCSICHDKISKCKCIY